MSRIRRASVLAMSSLVFAIFSHWAMADFNQNEVSQLGIKNLRATSATSFSGGQPTQKQLQALADTGVKHIINLRTASEQSWDEKALVEKLGMEYHSIPIAGKSGITVENARTLNALLKQLGSEPILLHCASGNRVGGLMALAAFHVDGKGVDAAIAEGKAWGLTRLEPFVRAKLSE